MAHSNDIHGNFGRFVVEANHARPISKTIVAELKVQVADRVSRSLVLKAAQAARVGHGNFSVQDVTIGPSSPFVLNGYERFLIVSSFAPLVLLFSTENPISLTISGLYCHIGATAATTILSSLNGSDVRASICHC